MRISDFIPNSPSSINFNSDSLVTFVYHINNNTGISLSINNGNPTTPTTATIQPPTNASGRFTYNFDTVRYQTGLACPIAVTDSAIITVKDTLDITISGTDTVYQNESNPTIKIRNNSAEAVTVTYAKNDTLITINSISPNSTYPITQSTIDTGRFIYKLKSTKFLTLPNSFARILALD